MMKKILLAVLISISSTLTFAETAAPAQNPVFASVEKLVQAKDYAGAYKELEKIAKTGNVQALYHLAVLTQIGQGTTKDEKKALDLFQQAAKKGDPLANYTLAKSYMMGGKLGLKPDVQKAKEYFQASAKAGFEDANVDLAVLFFSENKAESDKQGLAKLEPLIKKNHPQAIYAKALYDINLGFKNKDEKSVKSGLTAIQQLAEKGYIPALMAVGNMFTNGNIIDQDLVKAKEIFSLLAQKNVPNAKESLALVEKMMAEKVKPAAAKSKS